MVLLTVFLDKAFPITGPILLEAFNNLLTATELPETMKPVLLKFILKEGKDKNEVTSYRPIAPMSTITRLFSKILVNRLQPIFHTIISEDQEGFIHGRSSHYNIQRVHQLVGKMNQHPDKFQNSFILHLDFQKAFDRVSHQFLKQQLKSISIRDKIINAIMLIVTQQQGQIFVNNFLGMPFPITQGLRQGDLLKMILMADDVIVTVDDEKDATIFQSLIKQFEQLSNLKLNPTKSVAYGTPGAKNNAIVDWGSPINLTTDPTFVSLGIPLNGLNWETRLKDTLKKIPPLWDKCWKSWFALTSRSGSHPNTPAQPTSFSITSLTPASALNSNIQHSFTSSPLQDTSFNSTSKAFYESNWKDSLLIPSRAKDKTITGWKQFWSIFSKYVNKNPGSFLLSIPPFPDRPPLSSIQLELQRNLLRLQTIGFQGNK
ncbi:unnamed protein product [Ambrosiozyma monospora]|uniref:Unnamed protein product n=1 Tax=Ambrosiozyma monospora TaxID=43982 RepID=A0A9W6YM05_AMBMO|nr:unnamed protein product [Ambrosiozyma monospora]